MFFSIKDGGVQLFPWSKSCPRCSEQCWPPAILLNHGSTTFQIKNQQVTGHLPKKKTWTLNLTLNLPSYLIGDSLRTGNFMLTGKYMLFQYFMVSLGWLMDVVMNVMNFSPSVTQKSAGRAKLSITSFSWTLKFLEIRGARRFSESTKSTSACEGRWSIE